ncbi:glutathione S-transferase family protein [Pleionea sp. CnH1-48]|uniref:glutathione S-transferase family protein n=1 Tax=Pleionea sp. CnH1-48 TaxID=2954494 RepID=UPI002097AADF|nr:glutathione S-transferase family protein [Pleionea sp. CnH1-48]MCO7225642.1 glutathione S-transferase family protein [Pleionea sp. CnH1-48]
MKTLELISFELCPFVQRSVITLLKKDVDFKITYIDLANKPDWFLALSPLGKVPVLRVDDDVLFESAVINEYLDEITPGSLLPQEALPKAKARAWIEYSSQQLMNQYQLTMAKTEADFKEKSNNVSVGLQRLEAVIQGSYFNGDDFSLVDSALAPLLMRYSILERQLGHRFIERGSKLEALSHNLLEQHYVKQSVVGDFKQKLLTYLDRNQSYLVSQA